MKRLVLFSAIALVAFLPLMVSAQTDQSADEEHDLLEVAVHGGLGLPIGSVKTWSDSLGAKAGFSFGGEVGLFLNKDMVLGFQFNYYHMGINTSDSIGGNKHRLYSSQLYLKRYFSGNSNWVPYVRLSAGVDFPKFTTTVVDAGQTKFRELSYNGSFGAGIGVGLFYYTSDYSGIYAEANFHETFSNGVSKSYGNADYRFPGSISMFDLKLGIRAFFGSGT